MENDADSCKKLMKEAPVKAEDVAEDNKGIKQLLKVKIQETHSLKLFVAIAGILLCAQNALSMYTKSVLTSIENEFKISSTEAGCIIGSFNIGNMIFVAWVSQFSSKRHRPHIMMLGSILIVIGGLINSSPHLLSMDSTPMKNTTNLENGHSDTSIGCTTSRLYYFLVAGEFVQGIGATVLVPLSSSYIDDFCSEANSSLYIGIVFLLQNLGSGVGYLVGSMTSKLDVNFNRVAQANKSDKTSGDDWIGAWWLGYIILSCLVLLAAVPLVVFPKDMRVKKQRLEMEKVPLDEEEDGKDKGCLNSVKDMLATCKNLLLNPIYTFVVCGYAGVMFIVGSFSSFMPKLLEVVFHQTKSNASLSLGLSLPFVICIGLLSAGILSKRFNWSTLNNMTYIVASSVITVVLIIPTYFITCNEEHIIANCSSIDCSLRNDATCKRASVILVSVMSMAALSACNFIIPSYAVIMRTVPKEDKCTAIGLKFLILRAVAFIPAPVATGAVIDSTCTEWKKSAEGCDVTYNCQVYDNDMFRWSYYTVLEAAAVFSLLSYSIAYICVRNQQKRSSNENNFPTHPNA